MASSPPRNSFKVADKSGKEDAEKDPVPFTVVRVSSSVSQVRPEVNSAKVSKKPSRKPTTTTTTTTTARTVFKFSRPESENRFRDGFQYCWKCLQSDHFGFERAIACAKSMTWLCTILLPRLRPRSLPRVHATQSQVTCIACSCTH